MITKSLDKVHEMMKDQYNNLSKEEKEKYDIGGAATTWNQLQQLIIQVIANGGTVTIK